MLSSSTSYTLELDECSDPSFNDCHMNANCTDIPGSYVCDCELGYEGNGTFCESKFFEQISVLLFILFANFRR